MCRKVYKIILYILIIFVNVKYFKLNIKEDLFIVKFI